MSGSPAANVVANSEIPFIPAGNGSVPTSFVGAGYGTFTANGTAAITIADAAVTASSVILISLLTVGGTVGALPTVKTKTAGTGFTTKATASDTSIYSYMRIG